MEQTFNDLCREKEQSKSKLFSFVLWTFIETTIGIFREYRLLVLEGDPMQILLTNFRLPALISFLLVIPFMIMEVVNRRNLSEGFPIPLFVIMWLLPLLFILTVTPILRNVRAGNSLLATPILLLVRVVFLSFLVWMWFGILLDQMPCFLGVPNCD
jgi:hypothetical protein